MQHDHDAPSHESAKAPREQYHESVLTQVSARPWLGLKAASWAKRLLQHSVELVYHQLTLSWLVADGALALSGFSQRDFRFAGALDGPC